MAFVFLLLQLAVSQREQKQAFVDKVVTQMTAERDEGLRIKQAAVRAVSCGALTPLARSHCTMHILSHPHPHTDIQTCGHQS